MKRPTRSPPDEAIDLVIPTQEDFQFDLTERCRGAVRATIQVVLDEELERLVGAGPYERSDQRVDVRNGRYPRRVVTTAGEVTVASAASRGGGAATAPLGRYARRRAEIDAAMTQAYVRGVSTRDMAGVTEALLGKRIGRSTVSRVTRRLEDQVEDLRRSADHRAVPVPVPRRDVRRRAVGAHRRERVRARRVRHRHRQQAPPARHPHRRVGVRGELGRAARRARRAWPLGRAAHHPRRARRAHRRRAEGAARSAGSSAARCT